MKLVDILARELKVWPEGVVTAVQDLDGEVKFDNSNEMPRINKSGDVWIRQGDQGDCLHPKELAEDCSYAIITRAQWQAAVDAPKAGEIAYSTENVNVNANYATHTNSPVNAECKIVQPEWSGEGLPPIGIDVEVFADYSHPRFDRFIGQQVHIVAHDVINGDPVAVFRMPVDGDDTEQDYHAMVAKSFRPIRTPGQIAADERDKAAEALYLTINWNDTASTWANLSRGRREDYFKAIDAGYRKFEIVDN